MSLLEILQERSEGNLSLDELLELADNFTMEDILNLTDQEDCSHIKPIPHTAILEVVISVLGFILNGIAIFVIITLRDFKKSISHWYVLQLAIADTTFLLSLLVTAHQHFKQRWELPHWMCYAFKAFFMTNYYAGIFFLTVMSFDRYLAIVHPVSAYWRKLRTHGNAVVVTIIVWVASILLSIPTWMWSSVKCTCAFHAPVGSLEDFYSSQGLDSNTSYEEDFSYEYIVGNLGSAEEYEKSVSEEQVSCFNIPSKPYKIWLILNFVLTFLLPVMILIICYSFILWRVLHPAISSANKSRGRQVSRDSQPHAKRRSILSSFRSSLSSTSSKSPSRSNLSQKHKVTVIVVSLVVLFIICWFPFYVVQLLKLNGLKVNRTACNALVDAVNILAYLNSMLNPIFYTFLGSKFCQRLSTAVRSVRRRSQSSGFVRYTRSSRTGVLNRSRNSATTAFNKATDISSSCQAHTSHTAVSKYLAYSQHDKSQLVNMTTKDSDMSSET